jgi:hypothetical protein
MGNGSVLLASGTATIHWKLNSLMHEVPAV